MKRSSAIKTISIRTLKDFFQYLQMLAAAEKDLVFRGQRNSEWQIQSAFHRFCVKTKKPANEEFYERLLSTFIKECQRLDLLEAEFGHESRKRHASVEAWAQHYGLPTRLVDWTHSPDVGAFFAFGGDSLEAFGNGQNCALFVLDQAKVFEGVKTYCRLADDRSVAALMRFSDTNAPYCIKFDKYESKQNKRIRRQLGVLYSVPLGHTSFEQYISRPEFPDETLLKIKLPLRLQTSVLQRLRAMKVSGGELYLSPEHVSIDTQHVVRSFSRRKHRSIA